MKVLFVLLAMIIAFSVPGQKDNPLLEEVSKKLENKTSTVSTILSEKNYLQLHPNTEFRQLIEEFAGTAPLSITSPDEPGKKIKVIVTLKNKDGEPVSNALVYLYQTDAKGWYAADAPHVGGNEGDMSHARLFGYVRTDKDGKFELQTVKPSGYPQSDLPAHIHIHFSARGYRNYVTELLFDDDERLVGDIRKQSIQNRFFISKPEKSPAPFEQQFTYTILLSKE
jgi:protocatechuate 3,4-dioxygenase beta subunit